MHPNTISKEVFRLETTWLVSHPCYPYAVWTWSLALAFLPISHGDPIIFLPHGHLPSACTAWQSWSSLCDLQQQLQVPFADHCPPCAGAIQTENSTQFVIVLQAYFCCSLLLHVLFQFYADEANSVRTRNLKHFRVLFELYFLLLAIWYTVAMYKWC